MSATTPQADHQPANPMRPIALAVGLAVINQALNATQAKYGQFIPDWLIIALWLAPIVPLGWWLLTHDRLRDQFAAQRAIRPKTAVGVVIGGVILILFSIVGASYRGYVAMRAYANGTQSQQRLPVVAPPTSETKETLPRTSVPIPPSRPVVRLIFKASPLFREERKKHITDVVDQYCRYLRGIGFDVPVEFPPLGVRPGKVSTRGGVFTEGERPSIYDESLYLGANSIDNANYIRASYSNYIFERFLVPNPAEATARHGFYLLSTLVFSNYFLADFSNTPPPPPRDTAPADKWIAALWDIRAKHGREFTNKSLLYALKRWDHPVDDPDKETFDRFFGLRFSIGTHIEDNAFDHAKSISSILEARGIKPQ